jgi:pyrophosphatase PpaX
MKNKGIIFDFDGTLADTLPICFYSFNRVFNVFDDRDLNENEIKSMFGPSEIGIIVQNIRSKEHVPQAIEAYYVHYD